MSTKKSISAFLALCVYFNMFLSSAAVAKERSSVDINSTSSNQERITKGILRGPRGHQGSRGHRGKEGDRGKRGRRGAISPGYGSFYRSVTMPPAIVIPGNTIICDATSTPATGGAFTYSTTTGIATIVVAGDYLIQFGAAFGPANRSIALERNTVVVDGSKISVTPAHQLVGATVLLSLSAGDTLRMINNDTARIALWPSSGFWDCGIVAYITIEKLS